MSVFSKLFSKKTKEFSANCALSNESLEKGFGYLLTTSQIISSRKFWDNKMTEPDTMSYSINHFTKSDTTSTQIRSMIFEKFSGVDKAWIISDTFIHWFDVDKDAARNNARLWWESEGTFEPDYSSSSENKLSVAKFQEIKEYAIMEAGRELVQATQRLAI